MFSHVFAVGMEISASRAISATLRICAVRAAAAVKKRLNPAPQECVL